MVPALTIHKFTIARNPFLSSEVLKMLGVENHKGLKSRVGVKKKEVAEGLKLKTLLPHFTPLPEKFLKIRTAIGSDGTVMWISECGFMRWYQNVVISAWVSVCGFPCVGISVWVFSVAV